MATVVVIDPLERTGGGATPGETPRMVARALIDMVPDLVAVVDASGVLLYANAAAEALLGYEPTAEVGRNMFEFVHPGDLDSVVASFLETVVTPGTQPMTTFRMRGADGDWRHVETTATNRLADPSVAGIVVNVRDVSDRVRAEVRADRAARMYRTLVEVNQAMAGAADAASMLKGACDIVVRDDDFRLAWVGLLEGDDVIPVAVAGEPADYVESLSISLSAACRGPTASAIIEGRPATVTDVDDPTIAPWRDRFVAAGFASSCAVPVRKQNAVIGTLNVYSSSPEYFDDAEIGLVVELAADLSLGLDRIALEAERAAADESLRRSEGRFRALVQGSTDAVCVWSPGTTISFITPGVTPITGFPPEHYVGTDALTWVHPDDHPVVVAALGAAHPNQEPPRLSARISHRDGGWRWVEFAATNMVDVAEIGGIVVNFHDVTTQREAEEQLRFNARLLESVGEAVIATDLLGRILYWNDAATQLYGWSSDEVRGRLITEVTPAVGASQEEAAAILESLARGEQWAGVFTVRRRDGSEFEAMVTDSPFFDETGQLTGIIGISLDVTEREAVNRQLREALDLLEGATDSMAEGLFALDLDGRATLVNRAAAELLGGAAEDLIGQTMHDLTHYEHADGSPLPLEDCPILAALITDEVVRTDRDCFVRLDGTRVPVSHVASPLHATNGDIRGCVVVFRDITTELEEERRAQVALAKLSWIGRIQDALDEDRFVLFAQPILDLSRGAVTKHELLLRMQTAEGDLVLPGSFLPAAEEFGLIKRIDRWVISQACAFAAMGHCVSFNLSGVSVDDPATLVAIAAALEATGAPPENLTCEITETALMRHGASAEQLVRSIRALGCDIALDDFGVGFGGFTYLKTLPITTVKIDRQFVADAVDEPSSVHVIQAIVSLAHAFDLETIAEGAESTQTVDLLRDLGVGAVQGFVIGCPVPAHQVLG